MKLKRNTEKLQGIPRYCYEPQNLRGNTKKQSRNNIKKLFAEYQEASMEYQETVNEHNEVLLEYQFALTEYHETLLNKRKLDGIPSRSTVWNTKKLL